MKIFFKESFPCCNSLIHQDKNSYGLPKWTIKTRTYDNCQKSWTILQFVKFQEKTVRSCRLYYSPASQWWMYLRNISEKNINILLQEMSAHGKRLQPFLTWECLWVECRWSGRWELGGETSEFSSLCWCRYYWGEERLSSFLPFPPPPAPPRCWFWGCQCSST